MLYSRTWQYGVRLLLELARSPADQQLRAASLAQAAGIPSAYAGKILSALSSAGLVAGKRGPRGGVRLAQPARMITLQLVADALEERGSVNDCILGFADCPDRQPCLLHGKWDPIRLAIGEGLLSCSLADLLGQESPANTAPLAPKMSSASVVFESSEILRDELL